jgi:hypothetical protein
MPNEKKPEGFPNLADIIKEMAVESLKTPALDSLLKDATILAKLQKKSDGTYTFQEAPKKLEAGWDNDDVIKPLHGPQFKETLTKDVVDEMLKNMTDNNVNDIFSKLLKKQDEERESPLMEVVVDPEKDMHWHPKDGRKLLASQMETRHLFFSLRQLFNKVVPPKFRIDAGGGSDVKVSVADNETKHAIKILFYQIGKRDNISEDHLQKLKYMAKIVREHL